MTKKELKLLGMALKALMDANMIDEVRRIITEMAEAEDDDKAEPCENP